MEFSGVYVGSSNKVKLRFKEHLKLLRSFCHYNKMLQFDYVKYGEEFFELMYIEKVSNKHSIRDRELFWIKDLWDHNYNKKRHACGFKFDNKNTLGCKLSKDSKEWLSFINKGSKNGFYGKKHTLEARKKMSLNHRDISGKNNPAYKCDYKGKKNPSSKEVIQKNLDGKITNQWDTMKQCVNSGVITYKCLYTSINKKKSYDGFVYSFGMIGRRV